MKHASVRVAQEGAALAAEVRDTMAPFFLRRTKADVMGPSTGAGDAADGEVTDAASAPSMPPKNDFIIWLKMDPFQRRLYEVRCLLSWPCVRWSASRGATAVVRVTPDPVTVEKPMAEVHSFDLT
jgi:SNF2 family DNA or RNA helicase